MASGPPPRSVRPAEWSPNLGNPIAPAPSSTERFVAAPATQGRDSADSSTSETYLPNDNQLRAEARSFRGLMSGNSAGESASLADELNDGSVEVAARELPLEAVQAFLAGRDPVSARELASWSALWRTYSPEDSVADDSAVDDSVVDDSTLAAGGGGGQQYLQDSHNHAGTDVSSLPLYQQSTSNSTPDPQAAAAAPDPDLTFAELLERHVRRTLATNAIARPDGDEVRIELTDVVLPDTALSLRRSSQGWSLLAVSGNRDSLERLDRFAPALVQRFAAASLGDLEIVTQLDPRSAFMAARSE